MLYKGQRKRIDRNPLGGKWAENFQEKIFPKSKMRLIYSDRLVRVEWLWMSVQNSNIVRWISIIRRECGQKSSYPKKVNNDKTNNCLGHMSSMQTWEEVYKEGKRPQPKGWNFYLCNPLQNSKSWLHWRVRVTRNSSNFPSFLFISLHLVYFCSSFMPSSFSFLFLLVSSV